MTNEQMLRDAMALLERAANFVDNASSFDWNEDRCVMVAVHLAGDIRAAISKGPNNE